MKTILLFITSMLLNITFVTASDIKHEKKGNHLNINTRYSNAQPIIFLENDLEFLLFPDGSFDFKNQIQSNYYNGTNSRRNNLNIEYNSNGHHLQYTNQRFNRGLIIKDRFGKITRIGNTPIYYNRMGNVTQIGSIDISYNRGQQTIKKVGGLSVNYNHWGDIVHLSGYVNRFNSQFNCNTMQNHDSHYGNYGDYDNQNSTYKKQKKNKK